MWPFVREWETPQPRCGWDVCWTMTQGSALRATLGFGTESRWDSRRVEFESPHLSSNGAKSISTFVFPGGADLLLQRLIRKLKQRLRRRIVRPAEILVKFAVVGILGCHFWPRAYTAPELFVAGSERQWKYWIKSFFGGPHRFNFCNANLFKSFGKSRASTSFGNFPP